MGKKPEKISSINLQVIPSLLKKLCYAVKQNFASDCPRVERENLTFNEIQQVGQYDVFHLLKYLQIIFKSYPLLLCKLQLPSPYG